MKTADSPSASRRGSTYVLVLGLSAIIMTLALGAMALARLQARQGRGTADVAHARLCAHAALEFGRHLIKNDTAWREHYTNGMWGTDVPAGRGTASPQVIDPGDGDLADDDLEPVVLTGTGKRGLAVQKMRVTLLADAKGLGCLQTALHVGHDLKLKTCTVQCDQTLSANHDIIASGAFVYAAAEAVHALSGGTYHGTTTVGVDERSMPDASEVFAAYASRGVAIPYWAIPWDNGVRLMDEVIFSPGHNPFWPYTTSPNGVYVIDCQGQDICIRDCRIVGTLVLLNAGDGTCIDQAVHWKPAVENYPALLVDGKLAFREDGSALDEDMENENFNPAHTPYEGQSDSDQLDQYPSRIEGLIYIRDNASVESGIVTVCGTIVVGHDLTVEPYTLLHLEYEPEFLNNPPPGFIERIDMKVAEGSYQRVVD